MNHFDQRCHPSNRFGPCQWPACPISGGRQTLFRRSRRKGNDPRYGIDMRTLFTCVIFLFTASFCVSLTIQEKQNFVRTIYNRDAEIYSEFYLQEPVLPKQYANEPKRYSWWEVYVLEFDLDNNEQPDLIVAQLFIVMDTKPKNGKTPLVKFKDTEWGLFFLSWPKFPVNCSHR